MLIKQIHLKGIKEGTIKVLFRKWKKQSVNQDSLIKTSIGLVRIEKIEQYNATDITVQDAHLSGYPNLDLLRSELNKRTGDLYKIEVSYHGEDPRVALRNTSTISQEDLLLIHKKLERMDRASKKGPWTLKVLRAIKMNPRLKAKLLCAITNDEKDFLKLNVRKLKNMGLTISHEEGYSISPRGITVLNSLSI